MKQFQTNVARIAKLEWRLDDLELWLALLGIKRGLMRRLDTEYLTVKSRANILALTPHQPVLAFASDSHELFLHDGAAWRVAPLELYVEPQVPDMGAYVIGGLGDGLDTDKAGYHKDWIAEKTIYHSKIGYSAVEEEGSIRVTASGCQIYFDGSWQDVVMNFRLREDNAGYYEFEHKPIGFTMWLEIMSGNSMDDLGLNGLPLVQQYSVSMGAYPVKLHIDGGTF